MIANIISRDSFALRDVFSISDYEVVLDSEYDGKSQMTLYRQPVASENDFLILHDSRIQYQGIIDSVEHVDGGAAYTITVLEMPRLFDQKALLSNEGLLRIGIEDFIADQITENFISNPDEMANLPYLNVVVKTHTPVDAKVPAENGIYNLCTYIGNALTNYKVFIDFEFTRDALTVILEKRAQGKLNVDTGVSEIQNVSEICEVKALTKLTVLWRKETRIEVETVDENGETTLDTKTEVSESIRRFFLKINKTITENMEDPDRAKGASDVIFSSAETEAAMIQEARNQFASNSYQHKISFDLAPTAKLIKPEDLYIGHACEVKTESGIKDSFLSRISYSSKHASISVSLGNMKVGLIEKLKGVEQTL